MPYRPSTGRGRALWALWWPAVRALIAPTALLLVVAALAAIPDHGSLFDLFGASVPPYGARYGGMLALTLTAFGAPWQLTVGSGPQIPAGAEHLTFHLLPMTVTLAWLGLLRLGLHAAQRARTARTGRPPSGAEALREAARTALVASVVTLLIGLLSGTDWQRPAPGAGGGWLPGGSAPVWGSHLAAGAGWAWAVLGSAVLAGLPALAVHGTDALRRAARRDARPRGWAVAGLLSAQVLAVAAAAAALAGLVLLALRGHGGATLAGLAVLPNLGLQLIGFGSGATLAAGGHSYRDGHEPLRGPAGWHTSLLDLPSADGAWRLAVLAAIATAALLGFAAHRRGLDRAGRLRLATVHWAALSALMLLSGALTESAWSVARRAAADGDPAGALVGGLGEVRLSTHSSVALGVAGVLLANLLWTALGALPLPELLSPRVAALPPASPRPAAYLPQPAYPPQPAHAPHPAPPAPGAPSAPQGPAAALLPPPTDVLDH
ncbi:hypothetical protein [Kitasatospora nipponensis]|uniref:hypothetical protein n=1 Tax=Kitasatospora nipponensis TaxID=258049 RepID=UPI0031D32602